MRADVVDCLYRGVDAVEELVTRAEIDSGGVEEVERVELVLMLRLVGDVEHVVGLEAEVPDDGVVDDRIAEEVLAPVSVWHHSVAEGHVHAMQRGGPESHSDAAANRVSRTFRMVAELVESFDSRTREEIDALTEGSRSGEAYLPVLLVDVTVAEHVLFC